MAYAWICLTALVMAAFQDPEVVARFTLDGRSETISRDDLALELSRRYRRTEAGTQALEFAIHLQLIRAAATREGVMPNRAETNTWIAQLEQKLASVNQSLETLMADKGMTREEFREFAALQLAHERLVVKALELPPGDVVPPQMLSLWLQEARGKAGVTTQPDDLRAGECAKVGDHTITELDLGRILVRTAGVEQQQKFVRQIVLRRTIAARASQRGVKVSDAEMKREIEARRREATSDAAYRGVNFEDLLAAQGTTVEDLRRSPVLRAQVEERKLVAVLRPRDQLAEELAANRASVLARHGARRRISMIRIPRPNDAEGRALAHQHAEDIRERIEQELPFAEAARTYSADPTGRIKGGDSGWHNRDRSPLPEAVVHAAFELEIGALSPVIDGPSSFYLLRVTGTEPEPSESTILERMRQEFLETERVRMLQDAKIEYTR